MSLRSQVESEKLAAKQAVRNAARNSWRPKAPKKKESSGWKGVVADLIGGTIAAGGTALGQPGIGAALGAGVSAGLRTVWGSGTYHVDSNSILEGTNPNLTFNRTDRGVRITNRELVTQIRSGATLVNGATEFDNTSYTINPGNSAMAPWLAGICTNRFAKYRFHGLIFEYVPTSGSAIASTNTALGTIAGGVNPDPNDAPWESLTELLHAENSVSSVPSNGVLFPVECAARDQVTAIRFISNYQPDGEIDPRLVAPGTFQLATMGQQAISVELGQLWVTYDVELMDPILEGGTLGAEGIYNSLGTPTRILENALVPVVLTVNQVYIPQGNNLYFNAPFEGLVLFQFNNAASALTFSIASNRPTTFQYSLIGSVFEVAGTAQFIGYMMKAESGTVIVLGGVAAPATFTTRVYFSPFPYGTQFWPMVYGPLTRTRALRAMPRKRLETPQEHMPDEDDLVPEAAFSRPPSPAVSQRSTKSKGSFVHV